MYNFQISYKLKNGQVAKIREKFCEKDFYDFIEAKHAYL
jgi:hypothetical protein